MVMSVLRSILLLLLLAFGGHADTIAQSFGFSMPEGKDKIVIPFEVRNQLIILKVKVNGSGPFNFILDSGSRNTFLLQPELKDSLKLQPGGQLFVLGAGLKDTVVADIIRQVTLESGPLMGKFQSVLVLNKAIPEISDMLGTEIHGILGADLFNRYAIHVNYKKQHLTLLDPDAFQPPLGYTEVPVEVSNNKGYIYAIIYNEWLQPQLVKLLVDCGASLAFLFNYNENKEEELYPYFSRYIESDVGIGLSGMIPGYIGRLFSAHIATHILNGIIISTVPFSDEAKNYFLNERDGLVGSEVLSKFNIWYNFPKQQMYIRPNSTFEKPFQYDMSGIIWTLQRSEEKQPVVKQVVDASPSASAGILSGDTLSTINGKAAESLSNADIVQMLKSKAGRKINFVFIRGDEKLKIRIRLEPYI
jgi:hypothetical protein